jgi:hypothetical protein
MQRIDWVFLASMVIAALAVFFLMLRLARAL